MRTGGSQCSPPPGAPLTGTNMPYLIDGHNLIGRHPGLSLADPDDERELLKLLADYARRSRRKLVVFFDRGQTGSRPQRHGSLEVHFVPSARTADDALLDYLRRLPGPSQLAGGDVRPPRCDAGQAARRGGYLGR